MVCQLPKRFGTPRHLQPCSATYNNALSTGRLLILTLPRWRGRLGAIRRYCASVISMNRSIPQNSYLVVRRPSPDFSPDLPRIHSGGSRELDQGRHREAGRLTVDG